MLRPDSFIGLAEETGLIVRLGEWVLAEACREAAELVRPTDGRSPFVSVNLAVRQVAPAGLVDAGARACWNGPACRPQRLQLEITESAMMSTRRASRCAPCACSPTSGVRIAIDDFGTGYSNLAYLRRPAGDRAEAGRRRSSPACGTGGRAAPTSGSWPRWSRWPTRWT